ncbi:MAG: hypothetical protein MZV70_43775 [Desulfobacterales bacterium]|nr:hypothetical protein [Desulfobacterales bacterium]
MELMGMSDPKVREMVYVLDLATIRKNVTEMAIGVRGFSVPEDVRRDGQEGPRLPICWSSIHWTCWRWPPSWPTTGATIYSICSCGSGGMNITSFLISRSFRRWTTSTAGAFEEGYLADGVIAPKLQTIRGDRRAASYPGGEIALHEPPRPATSH